MSEDNGKQVQEALEAIRKLVKASEQKLEDDANIVTLDRVVWRNPAPEEYEEGADSADMKAPDIPSSSKEEDVVLLEEQAVNVPHPFKKDENASGASDEGEAFDDEARLGKPDIEATSSVSPRDIKELTMPIARRGGGFYQKDQKNPVKPAVAGQALPSQEDSKSEPAAPQHPMPAVMSPAIKTEPAGHANRQPPHFDTPPKPSVMSAPSPVPSSQFAGHDFSFPASEALMTPASLKELQEAGELERISPQVNVPVAKPPVSDPAREVQMMFEDEDAPEEDDFQPLSQPNLHLVSDQDFQSAEEQDEGFSGTVRHALRSMIKEQVTSWLQNNMTDLIEDALSSPAPQKRPSKTTKRRDT